MALPKLNEIRYELEIPSTGEKIDYRPFLMKEQKILMMAEESEDTKQIQKALDTKDWNEFRFYKKILKLPEIVEHYKKHGSVKENPFEL